MNKICLALLAIAIVFGLLSCPAEEENGTEAELLSFKIGDVTADRIPLAISGEDYYDEDFDIFDQEYIAVMAFNTAEDVFNKSVVMGVSSGAKAGHAGTLDIFERPGSFTTSRADFPPGSFVFVRVSSGDGKTVNYYCFRVVLKSTIITIGGVTVAGETATLAPPAATPAGAQVGKVALTSPQAAEAKIEVNKGSANQMIRFALIKKGETGEPEFGDTDTFALRDGDIVCIEVTAENGSNQNFYKIAVETGRIAGITSVKIGDSPETYFLGIPSANWTAVWPPRTEPYGASDAITSRRPMPFITTVQPDAGFTIAATPIADSGATAVFAKLSSLDEAMPASFGAGPIKFNNGDILAIKVSSENGQVVLYYKIPLRIPGVTITKQPAKGPFIYHVGETATQLSVELSGAGYSVQWVWFSSYGASTNPVILNEGIPANQGTVIEGATGLTFTPDTSAPFTTANASDPDKPFYFARYVAARISRTGYSDVFSERTLVHVLPVDQIKDFAVDLTGLDTRLGPYTGVYQNQTFQLPESAFPPDFDIMKYSRFTASARLYSRNGELIRMDNDKANFALLNANGGAIKACYNFGMGGDGTGNNTTNNSLRNSNEGNDNRIPVTVTPAAVRYGTAGIPVVNDHFPVYIELVELRFQGPERDW